MNSPSHASLDLVLIGGGHAQIQVLKDFAMKPEPGVRLTLVTDVLDTPYSGMLPGYVEGVWSHTDMHINLVRLARFAGARLIHQPVKNIDLVNKNIILDNDLSLRYDILSINCGAAPELNSIPGADQFAVAVKPISQFLHKLPDPADMTGPVCIIGAGAAGAELALAFRRRYGPEAQLHLIGRSARVLPTRSGRASHLLHKALKKADITLHLGQPVSQITADAVHFADGRQMPAHHIFLVTAARPADWTSQAALKKDTDGFIAVSSTLQSVSHDRVFAAGDIASLQGITREKAGVFAVRAGPVLSYNLRALIRGRPLNAWRPQRQYLALVGLGGGRALASWGPFAASGAIWWTLKAVIDRRFMAKFSQLPQMSVPPQHTPPLARQLGRAPTDDEQMFCAACGAKAGADTLQQAMRRACDMAAAMGADPAYLPSQDLSTDQAELPLPPGQAVISQSVDYISQHISDPFCFGRIAALHALSDIFVAGHQPFAALATVILRRDHSELQADDLAQMLAGSLTELARHRTRLVGGHTSLSDEAGLGFAVTGLDHRTNTSTPAQLTADKTVLILTKPLGTGIILAAEMRQLCPADSYAAAVAVMLQSNYDAAQVITDIPGAVMTDVTGFGLARHAVNLSRRAGAAGARLCPEACPFIEGAVTLSEQGLQSSLFASNADGLPPVTGQADTAAARLLFDPQTSGGVLAAVPQPQAASCLRQLHLAGYTKACIIGGLSGTAGLQFIRQSEM